MRGVIAVAVAAWVIVEGVTCTGEARAETMSELQDFDQKWDYGRPDSTEFGFRALLPQARAAGDTNYLAQLLTQIARAEGLQKKFATAHRTLDEADSLLAGGGPELAIARVRSALERGRVFNSSGEPVLSRPLFLAAWEQANAAGAEFHAIDAAHMLAIIEPSAESLSWNQKAIAAAERVKSEPARNWLGSLYNNVGWTYHDQGRYPEALDMFEKALRFREEKQQEPQIRIAKWSVARCHRSLGRVDEALAEQRALAAEFARIGEEDGYVYEEIAECLWLKGEKDAARPTFAKAYALLVKDPWLPDREPERIARLKALGEVK